jgi:exopolysaccharide biosynthesis polyprenyl glycosylphosphotransferase
MGFYNTEKSYPIITEIWKLLKAVILGTLILESIIFMLKSVYISRLLIGLFGVINFVILAFSRPFFHHIIYLLAKKGEKKRVLIIGTGKKARILAKEIEKDTLLSMKVLGFISEKSQIKTSVIDGYPILGIINDVPRVIEQEVIDEIIFAIPRKRLDTLEALFLHCDEIGIKIRVVLDFSPRIISKVSLENLKDTPLLTFSAVPRNEIALISKRTFDILGSLFLLILFSPIFIIISILIKLTSKGPVIFKQIRCGLNGRKFVMYKFRSMVERADEIKEELKVMNELKGPVFKIKKDPRVTTIGRLLRKTSMDELPQLINVLKGDMSLVGPRPPLPSEVEKYERWQKRRLSMKPGLTSLWQISGRNEIDFDEWMKLDLKYIDEWSFLNDIKIILKTIPIVISGKGAY